MRIEREYLESENRPPEEDAHTMRMRAKARAKRKQDRRQVWSAPLPPIRIDSPLPGSDNATEQAQPEVAGLALADTKLTLLDAHADRLFEAAQRLGAIVAAPSCCGSCNRCVRIAWIAVQLKAAAWEAAAACNELAAIGAECAAMFAPCAR